MTDTGGVACATCGDERRSGEPWCLRCRTIFPDSGLPADGVRMTLTPADGGGEVAYISDDLPESATDFFQYLSYFADVTEYSGRPEIERQLGGLGNYLEKFPDAQRGSMVVYILDNVYRGAANVQKVNRALHDYLSALGQTSMPFLTTAGPPFAYVIDNTFDNPVRFDAVLALLRSFGLVVVCPEVMATTLMEHDTGVKAHPTDLPEWPRYAREAWHVALESVKQASSERRALIVLTMHLEPADLGQIRELTSAAGYAVIFRNEAPITGTNVALLPG